MLKNLKEEVNNNKSGEKKNIDKGKSEEEKNKIKEEISESKTREYEWSARRCVREMKIEKENRSGVHTCEIKDK